MTSRPFPLAIALIAFVLAPLLACCGAQAAAGPVEVAPAQHDCGHAPAAEPAPGPGDHAGCDGCEDCSPGGRDVVQSSKADGTVLAPLAVGRAGASGTTLPTARRFVRPPSTAPPRASPVRLHTKITV